MNLKANPSQAHLGLSVAMAAFFSTVGNLALFGLAGALGVVLEVSTPGGSPIPLPVGPVVVASVLPALAAGALFALLSRIRGGKGWFFAVGILGLLLSFGGPLSLLVPPNSQLLLLAMHVVAAGAILGVLAWRHGVR